MESTDIAGMWRELYVMLGTSSAALIGLFFIATSLHIGEVVSNPVFRVRAYNGTLYLPRENWRDSIVGLFQQYRPKADMRCGVSVRSTLPVSPIFTAALSRLCAFEWQKGAATRGIEGVF